MKQTLKQKIITGLALAGSFISGLVGGDVQAETQPEQHYSARFRTEATIGENTNLSKSTIGIAPYKEGAYNKYSEIFRSYNYTGEQNGKHLDWTTVGAILPSFGLGDWTNSTTVFGSFGDKRGVGVESSFKNGLTELILNAEEMDADPEHATRLGFEVDYAAGEKVNLGAGFDRVETAKGRTDYYYGKLIFNLAKTDQLGFAAMIPDESGVDKTNSVGTYYMHYGKEEKNGMRSRLRYDWNDEIDFQGVSFENIFAQNPTFSASSGLILWEKRNGGLFSPQRFENPAKAIEKTPITERSRGGLVACIAGNLKNNAGKQSGYVEGSVGYAFPTSDGIQPNLIGTYRRDFFAGKDGQSQADSIGASFLVRIGNLYLEAGVMNPLEGDAKATTYFSGQYVMRF